MKKNCDGAVVYGQTYEPKKIKNSLSKVYYCPFWRSCECGVQWRMMVNEVDRIYKLECNTSHESDSHAKYNGKFLAPCQRAAAMRAVQNDPNCTGNTVIRNIDNIADERFKLIIV